MKQRHLGIAVLVGAALLTLPMTGGAQILVSGNDEKVLWDDAGKAVYLPPGKDTISFIDIGDRENPKILTSIALENSIFGPPTNLAVHPSGEIALVANSVTQIKDGESWKPVPDDKVYIFDLKASPPTHIGTVKVGRQPSGLDISKKGDLALVTNRADNSISVLSISGKEVKVTDTIAMGDSVAHVAISADGTKGLAVKPVVNKVAFLKIDGQKVLYEKYDMPTGVFPYNVDIAPNGKVALVANNGGAGYADGNVDTVSVIDLEQNPPRVIDHIVVGDAPEGFAISPKGDLALAILVGGNSDKKAFFSRKGGAAVVLKIDDKKVTKVSDEIEVGGLAEGVAFSPDGSYAYIGNFLDSDMSIMRINGTQLIDTGKKLKLPGHPASLRGAPK
ncbi:YncE family protein [Bradyrhizobium erythrophlei]|uniref:YncE family protein n=1 Tax=Bradyrhizobium erythrophlei TaxID=1437360 RepID=UPI0035E6F170